MSKYILCELHNHTYHSDGGQTLLELAEQARALGFDCLALTDHNTHSGYAEIADVHAKTGILLIRGIEYTTFFGHFLVLGKKDAVHFRHIYKTSFENTVTEMKTDNSAVGIAHPFSIGNPICTGCFFEYDKSQPDIEYMEIWSDKFSPKSVMTQLAMHTWDIMLNDGRKICGVLGRDWHSEEPLPEPLAVTALLVDDDCSQSNIDEHAVKAIKNRHAAVTLYKIPELCVEYRSHIYITGDEINLTGEPDGSFTVDMRLVQRALTHDKNKFDSLRVVLNSSGGTLFTAPLDDNGECCTYSIPVSAIKSKKIIWLRMEVYGLWSNSEVMVAVTNPVFVNIHTRL